jgi:hypothetical protein
VTEDTPTSNGPAPAAGGSSVPERAAAIANERPEVAAGAAFGGGLLLALILKRLAR